MLRMYFLQQWYSLSDEGLEDAITDSCVFRSILTGDSGLS
jgi:IS5 family transposase